MLAREDKVFARSEAEEPYRTANRVDFKTGGQRGKQRRQGWQNYETNKDDAARW